MLQNKSSLQNRKNLLAFSGGADSTALLHLLLENGIVFDIAIVDYEVRVQSKEEVAFAQALALKHDFICHLHHAPKIEKNFEANARSVRYNFFESLIEEHGYENLLTAHHLGDRFEWMLMQFCKGAGCYELSGMQPLEVRKGYTLIRPLLHLDKKELLEYLQKNNISYFEDLSNADKKYKRNDFRHNYARPLLDKYSQGIAKSFEYLDADVASFINTIEVKEFNALAYFKSSHDKRSDTIAIDRYLKSKNHLITAAEKALLHQNSTLVLGRKYSVSQTKEYIFIAPYIQTPKIEKKIKEQLRLLKVDPKLRGYLSCDSSSLEFVSGLLA